jgi:hypothetical protein
MQTGFALGIALATELFFEDIEVFSTRRSWLIHRVFDIIYILVLHENSTETV